MWRHGRWTFYEKYWLKIGEISALDGLNWLKMHHLQSKFLQFSRGGMPDPPRLFEPPLSVIGPPLSKKPGSALVNLANNDQIWFSMDQTSDSEQYSNRLELDLISLLVNLSCELGQIMTGYDLLGARRVILTNVQTDSIFDLISILVNFSCELEQKVRAGAKNLTRRLCVLANTKLYHRNLLLWISMKFWILVSTTLGLFFQKIHLLTPIHIQSWPKSKLGQV